MKSKDQQLLEEVYTGILKDQNTLTRYPVVVPPNSREECIKILLNDSETSKGPWFINKDGKSVEISAEEAISDMDIENLRHEALHALQRKKIPKIFKNLPKLSHDFDSSEEYKMKHYYNRPPEIMAYAYDSVMNVNTQESDKIFQKIGGEVYNLYNHYKTEYGKIL